MGSEHDRQPFLFSKFCIVYLVAAASLCCGDDGYIPSRATYYGSPDCLGYPRGACGFGEYGRTVNKGAVCGVSRLYHNGIGCGACYQVKCKIPELCSADGAMLVATDYGEGDHTDFVASTAGYANLAASPDVAGQLFAYGAMDVEYRRVPCQHDGSNVILKIHERSNFPGYVAIVFMYVSGMSDILGVDLWAEDSKEWRRMRNVYGRVWDMENPPAFNKVKLQLGLVDESVKWVDLPSGVPTNWMPGVAYDTGVQL